MKISCVPRNVEGYAADLKTTFAGMALFLVLIASSQAQPAGEFRYLNSMPTARQELATGVLNGKIYVIGGFDENNFSTDKVEVYDPVTDTWSSVHPIPYPVNHNSAAVAAGRLYSFGSSSFAFVYDPPTDSWVQIASMHFTHGNTAAVGVLDDKIYVAGGAGAGMTQRELEVYDPVANTWTLLAPMSIGRNHTAGAFIDGKFYVAGGRDTGLSPNALEVYNPQTNSWATLPNMPTGRSGHTAAAVNGELFVFGGEGGGVHKEVEVFNPQTNSWRRVQPDMPSPRHGFWASVVGNKVYLPGGGSSENFAASATNEVFTVNVPGVFANIATRLKVGTGDNVLIGGFIVNGTGRKRIIVRAVGPSLPLGGSLPNPRLELYGSSGLIATNFNWKQAPNMQEIADSGLAPSHDLEPAILTTVTPGQYTAVVSGEGDSTGTALVEIYDLQAGSTSKLANISTRGLVQTKDDILIGGMIFDGQFARRTVVRTIGPSLGRSDALADPQLELRDANGGLVAQNNDWQEAPNRQEIIESGLAPGSNQEPAILQTLSPSRYTAIVRGVNDTVGLAVVEAYSLD